MPTATPSLTLSVLSTAWDVQVTVNIKAPSGEINPAGAGEAEVRLVDIGEPIDPSIYNATPFRTTDASGKVLFTNAQYSWINGWEAWGYSNRYIVEGRLVANPSIDAALIIWIGLSTWTPQLGQLATTEIIDQIPPWIQGIAILIPLLTVGGIIAINQLT